MVKVLNKRGTRSEINSAATANGLNAGEVYLITDENRIAMGTSANTYESYAKESETGGGGANRLARMNFIGNLASMDSDAAFVPEKDIAIKGITANLTQAPITNGSFILKKNGTAVATITLTANTLILPITAVNIAGTHADMFTVSLTITSGKNLTITLIYE